MVFRVQRLALRVYGVWFGIEGSGFRAKILGDFGLQFLKPSVSEVLLVESFGFRVVGLRFRGFRFKFLLGLRNHRHRVDNRVAEPSFSEVVLVEGHCLRRDFGFRIQDFGFRI